jgi:hypothetical protein
MQKEWRIKRERGKKSIHIICWGQDRRGRIPEGGGGGHSFASALA